MAQKTFKSSARRVTCVKADGTPTFGQKRTGDFSNHAFDRKATSARSAFIRATRLVKNYSTRLRRIARHIDSIIRHYDPSTTEGQAAIQAGLARYREELRPYAEASADKMVAEVAKANERDWRKLSVEIGQGIEKEVTQAHIAPAIEQLKRDQVRLITSLPEDASERVSRLTVEALSKGTRAETLAKEIYKTGAVTRARCDTIARTETSRAATTLTQARAEFVGSSHFRWVTAGDGTVRDSHKKLNNKTFLWADPPECDPGIRALPGCTFNCRCVAVPILDD